MNQLRTIGFALPLGIYRTDPLLGAALAFGLGLEPRRWSLKERIVMAEDAGWDVNTLRWWRPADWQTHLRRVRRQSQGILESAAIHDSYSTRHRRFEDLPRTTLQMIERWIRESPEQANQLLRRKSVLRALDELRRPRDWSPYQIAPVLKCEMNG